MYDGFVERAARREPHARRPAHHVRRGVARSRRRRSARPSSSSSALVERELHLGALVLNKVLPAVVRRRGRRRGGRPPGPRGPQVAAALAHMGSVGPEGAPAPSRSATRPQVARVLKEIGQSFDDYRIVATREREKAAVLGRHPELVVSGAAPRPRHLRPRRARRSRSGTLVAGPRRIHGQPRRARPPPHPSHPSRDRPPAAPGRVVGAARRPLLRRPHDLRAGRARLRGHPVHGKPEDDRWSCSARSARPPARRCSAATGWVGSCPPPTARSWPAAWPPAGSWRARSPATCATSPCASCASPSPTRAAPSAC